MPFRLMKDRVVEAPGTLLLPLAIGPCWICFRSKYKRINILRLIHEEMKRIQILWDMTLKL